MILAAGVAISIAAGIAAVAGLATGLWIDLMRGKLLTAPLETHPVYSL